MTCVASYLQSYHVVEWAAGSPVRTLRWGKATITSDPRFAFETTERLSARLVVIQDFTITGLEKADAGEYMCNIKDVQTNPGNVSVASARITLQVLYFPSEAFPVCSPEGPISLFPGTILTMQCVSEYGNPNIEMNVYGEPAKPISYVRATSIFNGTVVRSWRLTVNASNDAGSTFVCTISSTSFPQMSRSCTVGPISVQGGVTRPNTEPTAELTTSAIRESVTSAGLSTETVQAPNTPFVTVAGAENTKTLLHATSNPTAVTVNATVSGSTTKEVELTKDTPIESVVTPSLSGTMPSRTITTMTHEPVYSLLSTIAKIHDPSPLTPWMAAFTSSLVVVVVLAFCLIKLMRQLKSSSKNEPERPLSEPYIELQPKDVKAR
ncbi:uncharacterized protein LOC110989291 [Acanthaster planci]|uniref:Uncharacterized protein LOC110989291 n=1 Tax=Acanthaster planci TaxID=133434 RepID=A0A8B7ZWX1_ACAPL|nr:uncharacterized protein LOC110989291 [Acanthaster planci]XP_022109267.1 uncharacterized protein LOC110989291 [Acanthaster planci]